MKRIIKCALVSAVALLMGCTNYYKVTDPSTNKTYYTTKLEQRQGATSLKDARTGNSVTIQNSELEQINKEQFESGKNTAPAPAAAPAEPSPFGK